MRVALSLFVACATLAGLAGGALPVRATSDGTALLRAVDHIRSQQPFSGSLLVLRDGRVLASRSYGYADRARHRRTQLETRYRISGLTVTFTWIGLLQLRDAHRLDLDASVCAHFRPCPRAWRPLTPRHLAGPSTGLPALPRSAFAEWPPTLAQYVDRLRRERLYFKPGTLVAHNTSKYFGGDSPTVLAARLLEVVSRESWTDYVQRHILRPARMTSTGFERSKRDAVGYGRNREHAVVARPLPAPNFVPSVDLGLWSTVRDFARLDTALRSGKLLSGESLSELDTPALPNDRRRGRGWGCCWLVTTQFGHAAEVHGAHGFGDGFYAAFERYPEDDVLVLVFTNFGGSGPAFSVAGLSASMALGDYPSGVEVDSATLRQLSGVFEHREQQGGRVFTARMTLQVVRGKLQVAKTSVGFDLLVGPLLPRSESTFAAQYAPALELEFTRGPDGLPTKLVLRDVNAGWRAEFLPVRGSP